MKVVVDTNVAIAANGRNTHASLKCQYECIEFLQKLTADIGRHQIFLDEGEQILDEYRTYLYHHGEPGVGDSFYRFLHDHMYSGNRVRRVAIVPIDDGARGFAELPPNGLDMSDRKFLAVALIAKAAVANAMDTDWYKQAEFITGLGVKVKQLCPEHGCKEPVV
jgi:predicted nucleic acid-binding protein